MFTCVRGQDNGRGVDGHVGARGGSALPRQHAVALRVGQVIELARAYGEAHRGLEHGRQELFQARGHAREVARGQSDGLLLRDPTAGQVEHRRERERGNNSTSSHRSCSCGIFLRAVLGLPGVNGLFAFA